MENRTVKNKSCFCGTDWFNRQVDARTREALKKRNDSFGETHGHLSDEELLDYVRKCAMDGNRTPTMSECVGGTYIATRFGSWQIVLNKAGLPKPTKPQQLQNQKIYKDEFKVQAKLFKKERREQKEAKQAALKESRERKAEMKREVNSSPSDCGDNE